MSVNTSIHRDEIFDNVVVKNTLSAKIFISSGSITNTGDILIQSTLSTNDTAVNIVALNGGISLTPASGKFVNVTRGIKFINGTVPLYVPVALDLYESVLLSLNVTLAVTTTTPVRCTRIGNTIIVAGNPTATPTGFNAALWSITIPTRFSPAALNPYYFYTYGTNAGANAQLAGKIDNSGALTIGVNTAGLPANFTNSSTSSVGGWSVTYSVQS